MEINTNLNLNSVNSAPAPRRSNAAAQGDADGDADQVSLTDSTALQQALDQTPASRPDVVAHARQLIEDPSYPGPDVTRKLSQFLASRLAGPTE